MDSRETLVRRDHVATWLPRPTLYNSIPGHELVENPNARHLRPPVIRSYKWRKRDAIGKGQDAAKVENAEQAIITKALELYQLAHIESPDDRAKRLADNAQRAEQHRAAEQTRRDRILKGFAALWGFSLTDDERFALDELYYEAYSVRYSQR